MLIKTESEVEVDLDDYYKCDPNAPNTFDEVFCSDDCRFSAYIGEVGWAPARFTFEGYWHEEGACPLCFSFGFNVCPNCRRILLPNAQTITIKELVDQQK